jgi:transcription antitermination factor NusG
MLVTIETQPGHAWAPAYCKPRAEKVVAGYCERHGIPYYLPLLRKRKRHQRRTVESFLPMFPSYIFVQLHPDNRTEFLECHRIVHIVDVYDARERTLVAELNALQRLEEAQSDVDLVVMPEVKIGTAVTVTEGPLAGTTGIVERRKGRTRVTVNVELLGSSVMAEMDLGELEAVEGD